MAVGNIIVIPFIYGKVQDSSLL